MYECDIMQVDVTPVTNAIVRVTRAGPVSKRGRIYRAS
jgi:hypothetical protein